MHVEAGQWAGQSSPEEAKKGFEERTVEVSATVTPQLLPSRHLIALESALERGALMRIAHWRDEEIARDEAGHVHLLRLRLVPPHAVVADVGRRHDDDLPRVRRVGQDLLVPAHRGVEDDLPERRPSGPDGQAVVRRAVLEDEKEPKGSEGIPKGEKVIESAVRGTGKDKYAVAVTDAGRKYIKAL